MCISLIAIEVEHIFCLSDGYSLCEVFVQGLLLTF